MLKESTCVQQRHKYSPLVLIVNHFLMSLKNTMSLWFIISNKFQNIIDSTLESLANLLNGIKRNIIITFDLGDDIGTKASFLH